jgi:predicted nucleic acid-binding protein
MQEIFNQFELAREFDYGQNQEADKARAEQREKLLARHLKLVNSKTQAAQFMLKIRAALAKQGLLHLPPTLG